MEDPAIRTAITGWIDRGGPESVGTASSMLNDRKGRVRMSIWEREREEKKMEEREEKPPDTVTARFSLDCK